MFVIGQPPHRFPLEFNLQTDTVKYIIFFFVRFGDWNKDLVFLKSFILEITIRSLKVVWFDYLWLRFPLGFLSPLSLFFDSHCSLTPLERRIYIITSSRFLVVKKVCTWTKLIKIGNRSAKNRNHTERWNFLGGKVIDACEGLRVCSEGTGLPITTSLSCLCWLHFLRDAGRETSRCWFSHVAQNCGWDRQSQTKITTWWVPLHKTRSRRWMSYHILKCFLYFFHQSGN